MKTAIRIAILAAISFAGGSAAAGGLAIQVSDSSGKPLADAVVWADAEASMPVARPLKPAEIEQRGLTFLPLVSVIQTGSRVAFPNNDRVKHHIYSFSPAKKFDQKLYSGAAAATQVFDKPGLVVLGCNIHDRMVAYVKVVDTPLFAKTDAAGIARIELPAAGKYTVSVWHYNMSGPAVEQALAFNSGDPPASLSFKLIMKPAVANPDLVTDY